MQHLWTALGIALLFLLMVELILDRLLLAVPPVSIDTYRQGFVGESDAWLNSFGREMAQTVATFETTGVRWQPFSYSRGQTFKGQFVNVDERGLRPTWRPTAAPSDPVDVRIFAFGGSAMWGVGNRDDKTIPALVGRELLDRGIRAEVVNFGQLGHVNTQEMITLTTELQRRNLPDLVIFFDGFNDICSSYMNKRPGVSLHEEERRREFKMLRRSPSELFALGVGNLKLARLLAAEQNPGPVAMADGPGWHTVDELARDTLELYHRNVRVVRALGREFGFQTLFCWQPLAYTKRQLTDFEQQQVTGRGTQRSLCLAVYQQAARAYSPSGSTSLGEPWGPAACFLADVFDNPPWDKQTAFYDRCHLTEQANAAIAERLLPAIVDSLSAAH
jgi:lysophospholipase L1-like esterase